tara:strand:+ start:6203 stop:8629 length:2427 start_codon:yes stop_codon:yes gene_type:complete
MVSKVESIVIDTETWGQRELLEEICSRYFVIGNQSGLSEISWEINSRDGEDVSTVLVDLNSHLKPLSLIALLDEGNPPILSITRFPVDPVNVPSWQQSLIWLTMFIFTTLSGCYWISQFENNVSIFNYELLSESIMYFSFPVFLTILSAHLIRKYVASLFRIDVGNLVPIAFPLISPFWPFGIVGVFGQKRVDTIAFPNRRSLGIIELSPILVLIFFGSIFSLIGLMLTSANPPESISNPLLLQPNFIVDLLSGIFIGDEFRIKLQWLHPIALAGFGLSIIGWILILPIPGFPGDRILHSILGSKNLDKSTNATSIFLFTLTFMCLVFLSTTFWPWLILASLASWRRFSGEHIPVAFIVDESSALDSQSRNFLTTVTVAIILIGFPGLTPVDDISDWDGGLDISEWENEFSSESWDELNKTFGLKTSGIMSISGNIKVLIDGESDRWIINSDCFNDEMICNFEGINQNNEGEFKFSVHDNYPENKTPVQLRLIIESDDELLQHILSITYSDITSPSPTWERDNTSSKNKICNIVEVVDNQTGNLSVKMNPFWSLEDSGHLSTEGPHEICLIAERGGWESLSVERNGIFDFRMAPKLVFQQDNGNITEWQLPINNSFTNIFSNSNFGIGLNMMFEGVIYSENKVSPFCPFNANFPKIDLNSEENLTLIHGSPLILEETSSEKNLLIPEEGWLVNCGEGVSRAMILNPGLGISLDGSPLNDSSLPFSDLTLHSQESENLSLTVDIYSNLQSDTSLDISFPNQIPSNGSVDVNISLNDDSDEVWRVFWISQNPNGLVLNFVSKCPIGGCLN